MITVPNATIAYTVLGSVHRRMEYWKRAEELWEFDAQPAPTGVEEQDVSRVVIDDKGVFAPRSVTLPNGRTVKMDPDASFKLVSALSRRFEEIAIGVGVPVIARLPQDQQRSVLPDPAGMTLAAYWKKTWNSQIMHKWHQGILLFCSTRWALEDLPISAEDVKKLQKTNRDELLPFPLLVDFADRFSKEQLLRLRLEFASMVRLAETRGTFALFKRHPNLVRQAMSKNGLAITRDVAAALRASLSWRVYEPIHLGRAAVVGISKKGGIRRYASS